MIKTIMRFIMEGKSMREIKFRAWDSQDERMAQRFLPDWGNISQKRYKLMQYTGLKDRHGVEIYEGDILKPTETSSKRENRKVEYVDGSFCYSLEGHLKPNYYSNLTQGKSQLFYVIGNIWENPELLKG